MSSLAASSFSSAAAGATFFGAASFFGGAFFFEEVVVLAFLPEGAGSLAGAERARARAAIQVREASLRQRPASGK
jgi:hypothetical protein